MSNLTQRLTQLRKQTGQNAATTAVWGDQKNLVDRVRMARASALKHKSQQLDEYDLAQQLDGEVYQPGLIRLKSKHTLSSLHGTYNASLPDGIQQIEPLSDVETLLFVDTETTGLSTAAGTMVFLLGVAEIKNNHLLLEQMLLTQINAEGHLLQWFNSKCSDKTHLVSYNGKSFDIPLLSTRFRMARLASDLLVKSHIDLLHWVRRCHGKKMADCRLPSAEKFCLEFSRIDDLPGSEAPLVWQEMLRFGDTSRIKPLVQHHAWDVISLAGLLHYVENCLANMQSVDMDYLTMANYFFKNNQHDKAKVILETNFTKLNINAKYLLGHLYRREGQWNLAVNLWQQLDTDGFIPATESLAKYYEHKIKEYDKALALTQQLIAANESPENCKRLMRLKRKLNY